MFKELVASKHKYMLTAAYLHFFDKLGFSEEERSLINIQEVGKLPHGTGGVCVGTYLKDELVHINIKLATHASAIGMVDVLAHELIHAKQHLKGDFYFKMVSIPIFWGLFHINVKHQFYKEQDLSVTAYYDKKCEQEAHALSHDLTMSFFELLKQQTDSKNNNEDVIVYHI